MLFPIYREDSAAILKIDKDWIGYDMVQDAHYVTLLLLVERFRRLKRNVYLIMNQIITSTMFRAEIFGCLKYNCFYSEDVTIAHVQLNLNFSS